MKKFLALALVFTALTFNTACATTGISLKQKTVNGLQASVDILTEAQTLSRSFCFINPAVEAGLHCTNPIAAQLGMTDAVHVKMATFFADAFGVADKAALVIPLWKAGDPTPTTVQQYMTDLQAILAAAKALDPAASPLVTKVQTAVTLGASVASALGVR